MTARFFIVFLYTHGLTTLTLSKMYVMMPSTRQKRHDNDKHDSDKAGLFQSQCHFINNQANISMILWSLHSIVEILA